VTGATIRRALQVEVGLAELRGGGGDLRLVDQRGRVDERAVARQVFAGAARAASAAASSSRACANSSEDTAPVATSPARRATSARAFSTAYAAGGDVGAVGVHCAVEAAHLAHGVGEIGGRLFVGHARIVLVQLHQHLARDDLHAVVGADADDRARRLRRDRDDIALDVRIVGVFVPARDEQVPQRPCDAGDHHDEREDQEGTLALAAVLHRRGGRLEMVFGGGHRVEALAERSAGGGETLRVSDGMRDREAAAEGALQVDGGAEALRTQRDQLLVELQQRALRGEHVELRAEAGA
jgi:hypothetical protein